MAAACLLAPASGAQGAAEATSEVVFGRAVFAAPASAGCEAGIVNDDGTFEGWLSFHGANGSPLVHDAAMRFTGPGAGRSIEQVCVCWRRSGTASPSLDHEIRFYRANGPGGGPGSLLAAFETRAEGIGTQPTLLAYDVRSAGVTTPGAGFFVGVRWNSGSDEPEPAYAICTDDSSPPLHPIFFKPEGFADWFDLADYFPTFPPFFNGYRALGIRAELTASGGEDEPPEEPESCELGACVEDDATLCLNGGRFEVEAGFDPPNDADDDLAPALAHPLTADTGTFTFFDADNVEAVVKVLDACTVNQRHWVFAAGLTDVRTEIRVCDRATGELRRYTNPQGTPFQPIQDTDAFATCP